MIKYKKAQMETFGLAFIIILLVIGMFLVIKFSSSNSKDTRKEFINDEMAVNFVNSIVTVHVEECYENKYTLSDVIKFCARGDQISCKGKHVCELAENTIDEMLNKTLMHMDYSFMFYTTGMGDNLEIEIVHRDCTNNDERGLLGTAVIPLRPYPNEATLNLQICKK